MNTKIMARTGLKALLVAGLLVVCGLYLSRPLFSQKENSAYKSATSLRSQEQLTFNTEPPQLEGVQASDEETLYQPYDGSAISSIASLGAFDFEIQPWWEDISLEEARREVDSPIKIPGHLPDKIVSDPVVSLVSEGKFTFNPDLQKIQDYLQAAGAKEAEVPQVLDGATIVGLIPPEVHLTYKFEVGPSQHRAEKGIGWYREFGKPAAHTLTISQSPLPTLMIDRDINHWRERIRWHDLFPSRALERMIVSGEASALALTTGDIVSAIESDSSRSHGAEKVSLAKAEALLFHERFEIPAVGHFPGNTLDFHFLIWVEDGKLYSVKCSGVLSREAVLDVAQSLE